MRLLIDGIFFQINNTGIARVWRSIIPHLIHRHGIEVCFLDRGNAPAIEGVEYIPFPRYTMERYTAADSALIQKVCDHYGIDVFTSSYYTSPMTTPMVLMVYDMIPELFGFNLTDRAWREKDVAISFAQRYLCISRSTRRDLLALYPEIDPATVSVGYCGIDDEAFAPRPIEEVQQFRRAHGLDKPYFLFVGSRVQHNGYKNSDLFFDALAKTQDASVDVFCVGGEKEIEASVMAKLPKGVRIQRVTLTDRELSLAYGGAEALVYPSLYEGFGMPVIEAMASGCPVITTHHGSLAEAAGDAACLIGGTDTDEMAAALRRVRQPEYRKELIGRGLAHVKQFRWETMAEVFAREIDRVSEAHRGHAYDQFLAQWKRLREIQASVDC